MSRSKERDKEKKHKATNKYIQTECQEIEEKFAIYDYIIL